MLISKHNTSPKQLHPTGLSRFCDELKQPLLQHHPFCMWITGPVGAGKSTFSRTLLHQLGVSPETTIASPTYTYGLEYQTDLGTFLHLDLYRLEPQDRCTELFSIESFRGVLVEWPPPTPNCYLAPTHHLTIGFTDTPDERTYLLST